MTAPAIQPPSLRLVPRMPERSAKPCVVPGCENPTRLYPGGWLCEKHKPKSRWDDPQPLADLIRGGAA